MSWCHTIKTIWQIDQNSELRPRKPRPITTPVIQACQWARDKAHPWRRQGEQDGITAGPDTPSSPNFHVLAAITTLSEGLTFYFIRKTEAKLKSVLTQGLFPTVSGEEVLFLLSKCSLPLLLHPRCPFTFSGTCLVIFPWFLSSESSTLSLFTRLLPSAVMLIHW